MNKFDLGDRVRIRGFYQGSRPFTGTVIDLDPDRDFGGEFTIELDCGLTTLVKSVRQSFAIFYGNVLEAL